MALNTFFFEGDPIQTNGVGTPKCIADPYLGMQLRWSERGLVGNVNHTRPHTINIGKGTWKRTPNNAPCPHVDRPINVRV